MRINRNLRFQLIALLIVLGAALPGCGPRDAGSNRSDGIDSIRVVITFPIADNIANAVNDQIVGQDRGM